MFTFRRARTPEELEWVYQLRYQVYCLERGFEDPNEYPDGLESDQYDAVSWHYLCLDSEGAPIGTARLIRPRRGPYPLEIHTEVEKPVGPEIRPEHLGELSRIAISKDLRRRRGDLFHGVTADEHVDMANTERRGLPLPFLGMLREMYRECIEHEVTHVYAAMERKLHLLVRRYGFTFDRIGPAKDYHGLRAPYLMSISAFERNSRNRRPDVYSYFREGLAEDRTIEAIEQDLVAARI